MIAMSRKILIIQNRLNKQILHYLLPIKKKLFERKRVEVKNFDFQKTVDSLYYYYFSQLIIEATSTFTFLFSTRFTNI